jgi:hypothetical protein
MDSGECGSPTMKMKQAIKECQFRVGCTSLQTAIQINYGCLQAQVTTQNNKNLLLNVTWVVQFC